MNEVDQISIYSAISRSGSGIGKDLALKLALMGNTIICIDINEEANKQTGMFKKYWSTGPVLVIQSRKALWLNLHAVYLETQVANLTTKLHGEQSYTEIRFKNMSMI